jgi:hypothetical protein
MTTIDYTSDKSTFDLTEEEIAEQKAYKPKDADLPEQIILYLGDKEKFEERKRIFITEKNKHNPNGKYSEKTKNLIMRGLREEGYANHDEEVAQGSVQVDNRDRSQKIGGGAIGGMMGMMDLYSETGAMTNDPGLQMPGAGSGTSPRRGISPNAGTSPRRGISPRAGIVSKAGVSPRGGPAAKAGTSPRGGMGMPNVGFMMGGMKGKK